MYIHIICTYYIYIYIHISLSLYIYIYMYILAAKLVVFDQEPRAGWSAARPRRLVHSIVFLSYYIYINLCVCVYTYIYIYVYTHIHIHIHICIYTHIHTYTHIGYANHNAPLPSGTESLDNCFQVTPTFLVSIGQMRYLLTGASSHLEG